MSFRSRAKVVTNGCTCSRFFRCSGGSVVSASDEERVAISSQRDLLERQCFELDHVIQTFSAYLEDTVMSSMSCHVVL